MILGILNVIAFWCLVATGFWLLPAGWEWYQRLPGLVAVIVVAFAIISQLNRNLE